MSGNGINKTLGPPGALLTVAVYSSLYGNEQIQGIYSGFIGLQQMSRAPPGAWKSPNVRPTANKFMERPRLGLCKSRLSLETRL